MSADSRMTQACVADSSRLQHHETRPLVGTLAATVFIQVLGLATGAITARLLGVQGRGLLAAAVLWPSVIAYFGDLGGPNAYVYLAARGEKSLRALAVNAGWLSLGQSFLLVAVGAPVVWLATRQYQGLAEMALPFLILYLPLNLLTRYLNSLNQGLSRFGAFNRVRITVQVSYLIGLLFLFALHLSSVASVLVMLLASNAIVMCMAVLEVRRASRPLPPSKGSWALVRDTFRYGLRAHFGNLTPVDSMQLDLLVVVTVLGARNGGLYAVAASAGMVIRAQGSAFGMLALPKVASSVSQRAGLAVGSRIFRLALGAHLSMTLVIVASAGLIVPVIYGSQFAPAVPLVRIVALGMIAASLRQVLGDCLRGLGKPLAGTVSEAASWVIAVCGLILLVPVLGAAGAALAVGISYLTSFAISIAFALRSGFRFSDLFLLRLDDFRVLRAARVVAEGPTDAARRPA